MHTHVHAPDDRVMFLSFFTLTNELHPLNCITYATESRKQLILSACVGMIIVCTAQDPYYPSTLNLPTCIYLCDFCHACTRRCPCSFCLLGRPYCQRPVRLLLGYITLTPAVFEELGLREGCTEWPEHGSPLLAAATGRLLLLRPAFSPAGFAPPLPHWPLLSLLTTA